MCVFCDQSRNGFIILIVNPETMSHPELVGGYQKNGEVNECVVSQGEIACFDEASGMSFVQVFAETEHAIVQHALMSSPVSIGKISSIWRTIYFSNRYVL